MLNFLKKVMEGACPLSNIAEFIDEHGALGGKVLEHYGDLEEAKKALEEHYAGE